MVGLLICGPENSGLPGLGAVLQLLGISCGLLLLLSFGSAYGFALGAESSVLAFLKAAPNVVPAEPLTDKSASAEDEVHPARRAIENNPIYDETNPEYSRLQRIDEATRNLKRDAIGFPDWMAALRSGAISPRAGLSDREKMNVFDMDVVMKNTKEMPYVLFPHQSHTLWLDCSNCHPVPFLPRTGSNPISMAQIFRGEYCGMCHDRVAFITFFSCSRCHSVSQERSPK
jgi:c(7)-type cytochrome triheme protein